MTDAFPLDEELTRFWRARADYLGILGRLHGARGEAARATDCLARRATLAQRLGDGARQVDALAGLSDIAIASGCLGDSLWALQQAALASGAVEALAGALARALPVWARGLPSTQTLGALGAILAETPDHPALRAAIAGALTKLGDPARAAELEPAPHTKEIADP